MCIGYLMLFCPRVLGMAAADPKMTRTAAELLDTFLREDFLPRYASRADSAAYATPAAAGMEVPPEAMVPEDDAAESPRKATIELSTDYEWVEAAFRGGRERFAVREFFGISAARHRKYGHQLVSLGAEVVPVRWLT